MNNILVLNESDVTAMVSVIGSSLFFILHWSIASSETIRVFFYGERPDDSGKINHILFIKYAGFIILGVFPGILFYFMVPRYSLSNLGLSLSNGTNLISFYWISVLGLIIIVMSRFAARRKKSI